MPMAVLELPYGRQRYALEIAPGVHMLRPPVRGGHRPDVGAMLEAALDGPIGSPPLEALIRPGSRVLAIVSDHTRHEPRDAMLAAVRRRVEARGGQVRVAVATGTHGRSAIACDVIHDGVADIVELGMTSGGTPVRVHRAVVEADVIVATGCIRPHYFAGFAGGVKAIFPGLGEAAAVRVNHRMKTDPQARAGEVDANPCRLDLEDAVARISTPKFLLNVVADAADEPCGAVAGDVVAAHRAGCALARPQFTVRAAPAHHVIASDGDPITSTLYQAAKVAAAVAPLVAPGGVLTLVAECANGVGPGGFPVVNEAIFRIGVLPRLAHGVRLELVSALPAEVAAESLLVPVAGMVAEAEALVIPHASQLLFELE